MEANYINEEELKKLKEELELQAWGLKKSDEAIKTLYRELEKKNEELRKLDKLKSDFVSTVSHELRTPLTTIREVISQTLEGILGPTTPQQREYLAICLEDVDRLKRIIDNLLDISKLESGAVQLVKKRVDIVALAKVVLISFYPKAMSLNLEIRDNMPAKEVFLTIDNDKIIQVFTNLIGNAFKFTEKGYIELSIIEKDGHVECSVADTGKGIPDEDLDKAFGKFQQFGRTESPGEKGTGLGLSISKGIIELHGGKIWVESRLNEGTKFTFTLPKG